MMLDLVMVPCTYTCRNARSENGAGNNQGGEAHLDIRDFLQLNLNKMALKLISMSHVLRSFHIVLYVIGSQQDNRPHRGVQE